MPQVSCHVGTMRVASCQHGPTFHAYMSRVAPSAPGQRQKQLALPQDQAVSDTRPRAGGLNYYKRIEVGGGGGGEGRPAMPRVHGSDTWNQARNKGRCHTSVSMKTTAWINSTTSCGSLGWILRMSNCSGSVTHVSLAPSPGMHIKSIGRKLGSASAVVRAMLAGQ